MATFRLSGENKKVSVVRRTRNVLLCRRRRGSDRINVAVSQAFLLSTSQKSRYAADDQPLRLASSPLPLFASQTEEDIAGCGLWLSFFAESL